MTCLCRDIARDCLEWCKLSEPRCNHLLSLSQNPSERWRPLPRWESPQKRTLLKHTPPPSCKWVQGDESLIVLIVPAVSASYIDKSGVLYSVMAVVPIVPPRPDRKNISASDYGPWSCKAARTRNWSNWVCIKCGHNLQFEVITMIIGHCFFAFWVYTSMSWD
jgi:hypothetical protein